jgi:hypothetical protein
MQGDKQEAIVSTSDAANGTFVATGRDHLAISFWILGLWNAGPNGFFKDLELRIAEAVERGFNCIRIESGAGMTHDAEGRPRGELEFDAALPDHLHFTSQMEHMAGGRVDLLRRLIELCTVAKRYNVKVILSSWYYLHTFRFMVRREFVKNTGKREGFQMGIEGMFDLSRRVALVTGAAGSLGGAIATVYADAGADLLLVDIDGDGLHRRAKALERSGQRVHTVVGSIGNIQLITELFGLLDREFGKIDILVNVAGPAKIGNQKRLIWRMSNTRSTISLRPGSSAASRRADGCWQRDKAASSASAPSRASRQMVAITCPTA